MENIQQPMYDKKKWLIMLKTIVLLSMILLTMTSCSAKKFVVPPVTEIPTGEYHEGKFVWHDLLTDKLPEVKTFYGELFGWEFEGEDDPKARYTLIKYNGKPIGGIVYTDLKEDINESQWISYLSVPDVDAAVNFIKENGGIVHRKPWNLNNRGRLAVVSDAQEALFVLFRASAGDPKESEPAINEWMWIELFSNDQDASVKFYKDMVGYTHESTVVRDTAVYHVMMKSDNHRAGIIQNPFPGVRPNWLPYIRVKDPSALVDKVEKLGGTVYLAPREDIRKGSVALIVDPSGAAVAIQRWPF
jgi:predicted enzyme related to lactoylglutathione lyase